MNKVELVGTYGGDLEHALAAWTSTSRKLTKEKRKRIPKFLSELAAEGHGSPFERSSLHFLVDTDVASHIHILKHRAGVGVNAESARYRELGDRVHIPSDWPQWAKDKLLKHSQEGMALYHYFVKELEPVLGRKRAKESARYARPYCSIIVTDVIFNFRSFVHFQRLRNSPHAQKEIRDIADEMLQLVREQGRFEHSLKAFNLWN